MDELQSWKYCPSYTVVQATLLILNIDPTGKNYLLKAEQPEGFEGFFSALKDSINRGTLKADQVWDYNEINWNETKVTKEDLIEWLSKQDGLRPPFFFDQETTSNSLPDYLNEKHTCYSPKLAAAVKAWEAVTTDPKYVNNKKSAKTNIIKWLNDHATDFGLAKDGKTNTEAIENQIAKVVNWQPEGGAPKTLGG